MLEMKCSSNAQADYVIKYIAVKLTIRNKKIKSLIILTKKFTFCLYLFSFFITNVYWWSGDINIRHFTAYMLPLCMRPHKTYKMCMFTNFPRLMRNLWRRGKCRQPHSLRHTHLRSGERDNLASERERERMALLCAAFNIHPLWMSQFALLYYLAPVGWFVG
jgi:hypothetical protein